MFSIPESESVLEISKLQFFYPSPLRNIPLFGYPKLQFYSSLTLYSLVCDLLLRGINFTATLYCSYHVM